MSIGPCFTSRKDRMQRALHEGRAICWTSALAFFLLQTCDNFETSSGPELVRVSILCAAVLSCNCRVEFPFLQTRLAWRAIL
jgi:hypothetical protein